MQLAKRRVRYFPLTDLKRSGASYRRIYAQTRIAVREARLALVDFARSCGFAGQCLDDVEIAVGEALANAVEHGIGIRGFFEVDVRCDAHTLTIEVVDGGHGFDHSRSRARVRPPSESLRGFGTYIMHQLMDEVEYSERGTRVRLTKRLPSPRIEEVPSASVFRSRAPESSRGLSEG